MPTARGKKMATKNFGKKNFVERNAVLEELSNPNVKKEAMELAECSQSFHGRQGEKKETQKNRFFQTIFADFYREKTGILATDLIFPKKEIPITSFELKKKMNGGGKKIW